MTVPTGTGTSMSSPPRPLHCALPPGSPFTALNERMVAEVRKGVQPLPGDQVDAAALAAVAAVRPAERDELLAAEADHAAAAVAGLHLDRGFVDELHGGRG